MNRHIGRRLDAERHFVVFLAHEGHFDALAGGGAGTMISPGRRVSISMGKLLLPVCTVLKF